MMLVQEIGSETWNALQTNIVVCCVTVVYSKLCLRGIASLRQRSASLIQAGASPHSSKHLVYLMFSTSVLLWPLFDTSDWSWRLNVVLPTSMLFRFLYKVRSEFGPTRRTSNSSSLFMTKLYNK